LASSAISIKRLRKLEGCAKLVGARGLGAAIAQFYGIEATVLHGVPYLSIPAYLEAAGLVSGLAGASGA
jgi:hypothetical protein